MQTIDANITISIAVNAWKNAIIISFQNVAAVLITGNLAAKLSLICRLSDRLCIFGAVCLKGFVLINGLCQLLNIKGGPES